ncbi:MAG: protein kinase, partial [Anaerolineae bacterium]
MSMCPSEEDLACYAAGDCDEARTAAIAAHLGDCDRCRTWVDRARADDAWLAGVHEAVGTIVTHTGEAGGSPGHDEAGAPTQTREAADEPPTEPPIEIEGYEILRELHRGGQGIVYQAIQKTTPRKVAIKVLLEGPFASERAKRRFEREIELVAQLRHPNIIAVFHSGRTADGRQYCVMDYVRGIPLDQYVHDHKLTLEDALKLFSTVCDAVNYAHQKGVIHRDLKPSNILVDSAGVSKVLDFGLAKQLAGPADSVVSLTSQVVGTLPYMSPEQLLISPVSSLPSSVPT